jgi:hypothetical protein
VRSSVTRRALRRGLAVRLTSKQRVRVVATLRGPGHSSIRVHTTLRPGTRTLHLRPHMGRGAGTGRTVRLTVTVTAPDGTKTTLRRTIQVRG